jgi:hypothetical protein
MVKRRVLAPWGGHGSVAHGCSLIRALPSHQDLEMTIPWMLAAVLLCVFAITLVLTIRRRTRPGAEPKRSPGPYWPLAIGRWP